MTRIYWYAPWPDDRPWVSFDLARHVADDGDEVVLHKLAPVSGREESTRGRVRVVADLPAASSARQWTPRWFVDRAALVGRRALKRNALIRRLGPDIVHLQLLNRFSDAWTMPRGLVVGTVHDVLPHDRRLTERGERLLARRVYDQLAAIVVHHPAIGAQLTAQFAVRPDHVHPIPLTIAPNRHPPMDRDLSSPLVVFFGAFRKNKGITELCEAVGLLSDESHIRFHFAGRGDAELEQTVRRLAARDRRVEAEIGYVANDAKERLLRAASVVVLPYTTFTSQSAVLGDAYAAGTPVLATDVGALGPSVRDDGTGWVLPSARPADIARSIRGALSDPAAWVRRSERCTATAAERSPENVAHSYRELYAALNRR